MLLAVLEGLPAMASIFLIKSEQSSSVVADYSSLRMMSFGGVFFFWLGWVFLLGSINWNTNWMQKLADSLDDLIISDGKSQSVISTLSFLVLSGFFMLGFYFSPLSTHMTFTRALFHRLAGFLIFILTTLPSLI